MMIWELNDCVLYTLLLRIASHAYIYVLVLEAVASYVCNRIHVCTYNATLDEYADMECKSY